MYVYITYIYIYICRPGARSGCSRPGEAAGRGFAPQATFFPGPEKGEVLLRGVGTLRCLFPPNASAQWQPDGLAIPTLKSGS